MKNLIVFNKKAGEGQAANYLNELENAFGDVNYDIYVTEAPRAAVKYIREYLKKNKKEMVRIYACGGDGTVHECVNGMVGFDNAELAIYPIGTGNDFIKYYGEKEPFLDVKKLINGKVEPIDLSRISGPSLEEPYYSINVINFGFDAVVGAVGNKNKEKGKKKPYDKALVTAIFTARFNKIQVKVDGEIISKKKMLLCTLAQGGYVGGKFHCAPKTKNNDGLIDVCLLHTMPLFGFLGILTPYTNGQHLDNPKFAKKLVYRQAKHIEIDAPKDIDICVDGEMIRGPHFDVEVVPGAIKLVFPQE